MLHLFGTRQIISAYAKKCSITGFSSLRGGGEAKNASIYAWKKDLISDPDVGKAFKYHAQYPGVMQGSQEGK